MDNQQQRDFLEENYPFEDDWDDDYVIPEEYSIEMPSGIEISWIEWSDDF